MTLDEPRRDIRLLKARDFFLAPFSQDQKISGWLVGLFLLINCLVFANVLLHDPRIEYDAEDHLSYMNALSRGRLVDPADSREFFVPPLPYAVGALAQAGLRISTFKAARGAQMVNGLLSLGLLFFLLKTCLLISPRAAVRFGALAALGMLPVYYRTFAFVRGEPYLAFFAVLALYQVVGLLRRGEWNLGQMLWLGITLGLCALSRQWGFFLFPAVGLVLAWEWLCCGPLRWKIARGTLAVFLAAGLVCGWFYASLYFRFGSVTAFNREPHEQFSLANEPLAFYLGFSPQLVFSQPVRPNFANQFWPMLYSDTWGDYWGYFSIYGKDTRSGEYVSGLKLVENLAAGQPAGWLETNYFTFSGYLGRVNLAALFPSLLMAAAVCFALYQIFRQGKDSSPLVKKALAFLLLGIAGTLAGYAWFLISYPNGRGDTIKASYVLQMYPYLAVLLGCFLGWVEEKNRRVYVLLLAGLGLVVLYNLPAMVTHTTLR